MDKIWRYRLGDDALRVRKAETIAVNTAIWLLLDTSGSMNGRPLEVATESLLAATLAMEAIPGTKVGVAVFPYTARGCTVGVVLLDALGLHRGRIEHHAVELHVGSADLATTLSRCSSELSSRPRKSTSFVARASGATHTCSISAPLRTKRARCVVVESR